MLSFALLKEFVMLQSVNTDSFFNKKSTSLSSFFLKLYIYEYSIGMYLIVLLEYLSVQFSNRFLEECTTCCDWPPYSVTLYNR